MAGADIQQEAVSWARDEADRHSLGETYDTAVFCDPHVVPIPGTPGQVQFQPRWFLLITCANPAVGEGPLFHMVPLFEPGPRERLFFRPQEEHVRAKVAEGVEALRFLAERKRQVPGNGQGRLIIPGR